MSEEIQSIVFLDRSAIRTTLRPPNCPHRWIEHPTTPPDQVADRLNAEKATVAIINRCPITADTISKVPTLKLVAVCATGYDTVDVEACRKRGIAVCNVRDWAVSMPEHIFALILSLRRQLIAYHTRVRAGDWGRQAGYGMLTEPLPHAINGSTCGIVGYGALGQKVEALAKAFGMKVVVAERKGDVARSGRVDLDEVIKRSDVLVVLCPLTSETRDLIGERELKMMQPHAILINVARGGIVSEPALVSALRSGTIFGAGLDVLEKEPPRDGGPLVEEGLNVIVTPHMGWCSVESLEVLGEKLISNIESWAAGAATNLVS